eukprot:SAG31_NODE_179_length_21090_cov_11.862871_2_plen_198_part_00
MPDDISFEKLTAGTATSGAALLETFRINEKMDDILLAAKAAIPDESGVKNVHLVCCEALAKILCESLVVFMSMVCGALDQIEKCKSLFTDERATLMSAFDTEVPSCESFAEEIVKVIGAIHGTIDALAAQLDRVLTPELRDLQVPVKRSSIVSTVSLPLALQLECSCARTLLVDNLYGLEPVCGAMCTLEQLKSAAA